MTTANRSSAGLPVEQRSDAIGMRPDPTINVEARRAEEAPAQATGFKAEQAVIQAADGSMQTEYSVYVGATHLSATIRADGSAVLETSRGRVVEGGAEGALAHQAFDSKLQAALGKPIGQLETPQQEANDLATIMARAFADNRITPSEVKTLTELHDAAQSLPASGPRRSITR